MKNLNYLFATFLLFFYYGCDDSKTPASQATELSIVLKPKIGNQEVISGQYYPLKNSDSILINRLDFYLSGFKVSNKQNQTESVKAVNLFTYSKGSNIFSYKSNAMPLTIDTFQFLVGLDDVTNQSDPTKFESGQPLSTSTNMYWSDWTKYRYIVFEGTIRSNGVDYPFVYHTGLEFKNNTSLIQTKNISANAKNDLSLILNIDKIFYPNSGNNILYKSNELITHSTPSEAGLSTKVALNFSQAFAIE